MLARRAQDLSDLGDERLDVVADAALAELAEAGEVAADLGRVDVGVVGELLRGDRLLAHLLGLGQHLQVAREPCGDSQRQSLGGPGAILVCLLSGICQLFDSHRPDSNGWRAARAAPARGRSDRTTPPRPRRSPGCARGRRGADRRLR